MEDRLYLYFGFLGHDPMIMVVVHSIIAMVIAIALAKLATKNMQIVPNGLQNVFESMINGIISVGGDVIGKEKAKKYLPLTGALALFILIGNLLGIIPGFESPTSNINLTAALAVMVFVYYHFEGIRENGVAKYIGHFAGPSKALAPLMFPIEIISNLSRIISLSFRLMGNIKGEDLFLAVLLMLAPWIIPIPAFALLTLGAVLQAFVFFILTYVYIAGAIRIDEGH